MFNNKKDLGGKKVSKEIQYLYVITIHMDRIEAGNAFLDKHGLHKSSEGR